jgi:multiple sugar transport system permease protein
VTGFTVRQGGTRARRGGRDFRSTGKGWLYPAPAVLILAAFVIVPTFYAFYVSPWKWNVLNPSLSVFKGIGNSKPLFTATDPSFASSVLHSLYFCGAMVIGGTAISLALALLLQRGGRLINSLAVAFPQGSAMPAVIIFSLWHEVGFTAIVTTIGSLQAFPQFFELSEGGPNNVTTTLSYLAYFITLVRRRTSMGAAITS